MFLLVPLRKEDKETFIKDMQQAFQEGAEREFGKSSEEILPRVDVEMSLNTVGAAAYQAMVDGEIAGGAIVVIDKRTRRNHLDFLYVKSGLQNQGIGKKIWDAIEELYPDTLVWETVTPYFEKRNLHFYINQCGFHAVEFFHAGHKDPHAPVHMDDDDEMFRFEKVMASREE